MNLILKFIRFYAVWHALSQYRSYLNSSVTAFVYSLIIYFVPTLRYVFTLFDAVSTTGKLYRYLSAPQV